MPFRLKPGHLRMAPTKTLGVLERDDACERKNAIPTEVGAFTYGTYQTFVSQTRLGACKAEEAKENGGSHSLESDRQKEGCGTILWRDLIQLRGQRGDNQQAKGQRNYDPKGS